MMIIIVGIYVATYITWSIFFVIMQGGYTPLNTAAINGKVEAIKALTEHGADIHTTDNVGYYV